MAHGKLGAAVTTANAIVAVYTAPATCMMAEVDVIISNGNAVASSVQVAISDQATVPSPSDFIESGTVVNPNGLLTIAAIKMSPGEKVFVKTENAGLTVRVQGSEQTSIK